MIFDSYNNLLMLLSARFQLFQFGCPDIVIKVFTEEIKAQSEYQIHNEKYDALWEVENIEHRIDPLTRHMFGDVNPNQIGEHEKC